MNGGMKKNLPTVEQYISFGVDNPYFDGFLPYEDAPRRGEPGRARR